jgi:hypothetical protein
LIKQPLLTPQSADSERRSAVLPLATYPGVVEQSLQRLAIQGMDDRAFELLVNELAHAALLGHDREVVRKMRAPDAGADSLILDANGDVAGVIQAKHHVRAIKWVDCEKSLEDAVAAWSAPEVIFAFPVDFSAGNQTAFASLRSRHPKVRIVAWELSAIQRMLDEHPQVGPRFFGPDARAVQDTIARTINLGGATVNNASELVTRALELGAAANELDEHFFLNQSSGPMAIPEPRWDELPWMSLEIAGQQAHVRIDAWARPEAGVELPSWSFTEDDAGRSAHQDARVAMARGQRAEITSGIRVTLSPAPTVIRELLGTAPQGEATLSIQPAEAVRCSIVVHGETTVEHDFDVRPVLPEDGVDVAFAADQDGLWLELSLRLPGPPTVQMSVNVSPRFGSDAATNAGAAEFLVAFLTCKRIELRAAGIVPDEGVDGPIDVPEEDELLDDLRQRAAIYRDLAFIERELAIDLPILGTIEHEDILSIGTIAAALETGEGTYTMHQAQKVVPVSDIPGLATEFAQERTHEREVTYPLFGRQISLGTATYDLPPVKIIDVRPLADNPHAPARVVLGPEGDGNMTFRLHRGPARCAPKRA